MTASPSVAAFSAKQNYIHDYIKIKIINTAFLSATDYTAKSMTASPSFDAFSANKITFMLIQKNTITAFLSATGYTANLRTCMLKQKTQ